MPAPYPLLNGTQVTNNIMYLFVYANDVTSGWFVPLMVVSFFFVILIMSLGLQFKFSSRIRPETSFAAACFATLGFAVILEQQTGLLSPAYFVILLVISFISILALVLSPD